MRVLCYVTSYWNQILEIIDKNNFLWKFRTTTIFDCVKLHTERYKRFFVTDSLIK